MRSLLLVFACSTVALLSREAAACSVGCAKAWAAPGRGEVVPANAPAVGLTGQISTDAGVFLVHPDGGREALAVSGDAYEHVLTLSSALAPGAAYWLEFTEACGGSAQDSRGFFAAESSALPTTFGTLAVRKSGHGTVAVTSDGPCVEGIHAAFAQFELELDDGFRPWLPVTEWELNVEPVPPPQFFASRRWASTTWGELAADGGLYSAQGGFLGRDVLVVFGACGAVDKGVEPGLSLGKYQATMVGRVAGTNQELRSAAVPFELSCDGAESAIEPYQLKLDGAGRTEVIAPAGGSDGDEAPRCAATSGMAAWLAVVVLGWRRRGALPASRRCVGRKNE